MLELLKEMGVVCKNKKLAEGFVSHYSRQFQLNCNIDPLTARSDQKEYLFWLDRLKDINKHLDQLHYRLKKAS